MTVTLDLRLEERLPDRVVVSVTLAPDGPPVAVQGVAVELFSRQCESISPRMLLPISGVLEGRIVVKVELRAHGEVPPGAHVIALAWWDSDQVRATVPADPWTELEAHMRGRRCVKPCSIDEVDLSSIRGEDRARLARHFPWLARIERHHDCTGQLDIEDDLDLADEISEELGLDEQNAEWLRELLKDED